MSSSAPQPVDPLAILHDHPEECAAATWTRRQLVTLALLFAALVALAAHNLLQALLVLNAAAIAFYLLHSAYKFWLIWNSLERPVALTFTPEQLAALPEAQLPTYTILVPLYRKLSSCPAWSTSSPASTTPRQSWISSC